MELRLGDAEVDLVTGFRTLPPAKQAEVFDFVEFLRNRVDDRELVRSAALASQPALAAVWDNDDDAVYDAI